MASSVLTGRFNLKPAVPCDLSKCTKSEIRENFLNSYHLNEFIFSGIKDQAAFYMQPERLRLPLIFYYGHTAAVYINKMMLNGLIKKRVNPHYESLFETGVDEMAWDDTVNYRMGGVLDWPPLEKVVEFRRQVKDLILSVIETTPLSLPVTMDDVWWSLCMGIAHERIHVETSSVLIRQLPVKFLERPDGVVYGPKETDEPVYENPLVKVEEQSITYGKPYSFPTYGWDNHYGEVCARVQAFEASKYKITNREFLAFIEDGGYENRVLWSEEGWKWKEFREAVHPTFWVCNEGCKSSCGGALDNFSHCQQSFEGVQIIENTEAGKTSNCNCKTSSEGEGRSYSQSKASTEAVGKAYSQTNNEAGGQSYSQCKASTEAGGLNGFIEHNGEQNKNMEEFRYRALFDVIPMPWDWPVDVNYHEARAFCAWKGPEFRLPIEAEEHGMRDPKSPPYDVTSDIVFNPCSPFNHNFKYFSSTPVNLFPPNSKGFCDIYGNTWEWIEDHFNGFPGTKVDYIYNDYSGPIFDGLHNVIVGGSWASSGEEASYYSRSAFRRHFFQHCGFRIVRNLDAGRIDLPVQLVKNQIYFVGNGIIDSPITLDKKRYNFELHPSTNSQFQYEKIECLEQQIQDETCPGSNYQFLINITKEIANKYCSITERALQIGCGIGTGSFDLTSVFNEVVGIDFCGRFIDTALKIQAGKNSFREELNFEISDETASKTVFKQLTWLPLEIGDFNLVLFSGIERYQTPKAWLVRFSEIVRPGGLAIIPTTKEINKDFIEKCIGTSFEIIDDGNHASLTIWYKK